MPSYDDAKAMLYRMWVIIRWYTLWNLVSPNDVVVVIVDYNSKITARVKKSWDVEKRTKTSKAKEVSNTSITAAAQSATPKWTHTVRKMKHISRSKKCRIHRKREVIKIACRKTEAKDIPVIVDIPIWISSSVYYFLIVLIFLHRLLLLLHINFFNDQLKIIHIKFLTNV